MFIEDSTSNNILKYRFDNASEIDDFALRILKQGILGGVFVPGLAESDEGVNLLIPVSKSVPLDLYLKSELREGNRFDNSFHRTLDVLEQAIHIVKDCARYMLGDSVLVKRLKFSYVSEGRLQLICIPSPEARYETDTEREFYKSIISASIYDDGDAEDVISLLNFVNSDEFDTDELLLRVEVMSEHRSHGDVPFETIVTVRPSESVNADEPKKQGLIKRVRAFFFPSEKATSELDMYTESIAPRGIHILAVRSTGDEYPLCFGPDIIGTDENTCSVCFPCSGLLEKNHCKIYFERNRFYIEDMGSKEGTFLNNVRLDPGKPKALMPADLITAGEEQFVFSKREPI